MHIELSPRALHVKPFLAMEIMERAKELEAGGRDIIYLCLGEPDLPTPEPVRNAAIQAIEAGSTTYTHSLGLPEIRQAIADHYRQRYGVAVEASRILVSAGTSPLMLLLFSALLNKGDELILSDPSYACYPNFIRFAGGEPVFLRTRAEDGFQPRPEHIRENLSPRTRGILINSPSNPTGSVLPSAWLAEMATMPVPLISDEIYHGLTYEGEERSVLEFTQNAFVLGGFSKAYAMTGWRLGYLIVPASCIRTLQCLHQNFMICAGNFVQVAGITALRDCQQDVARMRAIYDQRRRYLIEELPKLGLPLHSCPTGAFYALADARHLGQDSRKLALTILEETGVALTPGVDFGAGGEGYLRFSYANSLDNIKLALARLRQFIATRAADKA
ncbi:amino acid aminotransferase, putative [Syntrophotalea carbinolica DSM 2380]|uniref:Aminotransferase n=1 Tax=Syntrophotalea carbinolica (strain DSM 2380 / NBRC 103641 / GraBd1) TaxID=338963 RepID=Q3A6R8_SYNC1|nr:pyridoxal phosphate-dependent aminotransferase [Syntrophotalea carbinolica]ABA87939.1 amino acid aminotransferase, putative [Syntrophotalea carbinolica DSM 2380]